LSLESDENLAGNSLFVLTANNCFPPRNAMTRLLLKAEYRTPRTILSMRPLHRTAVIAPNPGGDDDEENF